MSRLLVQKTIHFSAWTNAISCIPKSNANKDFLISFYMKRLPKKFKGTKKN